MCMMAPAGQGVNMGTPTFTLAAIWVDSCGRVDSHSHGMQHDTLRRLSSGDVDFQVACDVVAVN